MSKKSTKKDSGENINDKNKVIFVVAVILIGVVAIFSVPSILKYVIGDEEKQLPQEIEREVEDVLSENFYFLESQLSIDIFDAENGINEDELLKKIKNNVVALESKVSKHKKNSEVSQINQNAGMKPVKVSKDALDIIKKSIYYSKMSEGLFDITVGNLVDLWGIDTEHARVPSENEIEDILKKIDYSKIKIDENKSTVYLTEKGLSIDLGAIAKGYVVDEIKKMLDDFKVKSAIINISGNIYVYGDKFGEDFNIGIRNPYGLANDVMGIYKTSNKTCVTSGVYERFFKDEKTGEKYHHILSTKDGYPIENGLQSVTIITDNSIDGDGLSTALFAMGLKKGLEMANKTENLEVIFITDDRKVYTSEGVGNKFEIIDTSFTLETL